VSDYDVYEDEMLNKLFPEAEVERLLTGQAPENPELALLGTVLAAIHVVEPTEPGDERVARFAANAATITRDHKPDTTTAKPVRHRKGLGTLQERLAVVAVAMFVLVGMSGLAIAADAASPGDALYGIARALERIGINDGAAGERITEAGALADRGQVIAAIAHAASAIEDPAEDDGDATTVSQAATALREAAVSVEGGDDEAASEEVRASVSAMLSEMADLIGDPDLDGAEFGRRVSEMARSIAGGNDADESPPGRTDVPEDREEGRPDDAGPPEDTPGGGPPDEIPGGPPEDVPGGPPDRAGGASGGGPPSGVPGGGPPSGSGRP
jgi:hypothetical protein